MRAVADGILQGGPTADIIVVLALLLHLSAFDPSQDMLYKPLPQATQSLFSSQKSFNSMKAFTVCLKPSIEQVDDGVRQALQLLLDELIEAIVCGALIPIANEHAPNWGI